MGKMAEIGKGKERPVGSRLLGVILPFVQYLLEGGIPFVLEGT